MPGRDEPHDLDELAAVIQELLTLSASPGVVTDSSTPGELPWATLTLVPSLGVHTGDEHPGTELVDVVVSMLLGQGFGLLARVQLPDLLDLPVLGGWRALLEPERGRLRIVEPGGVLYDGDVGPAPPAGWHAAARDRGHLIVLVGTGIDAAVVDRVAALQRAAGAGQVIGAHVPLCRSASP